jgi:uncharacterized lipoprotein NlpE involved in copper resistance
MKKILLVLIILIISLLLFGCNPREDVEIASPSYFATEYVVNQIDATQPYFIKTTAFVGYIYYNDELIYNSKYIGSYRDRENLVIYNIYDILVSFTNTEETESYVVLIKSGYNITNGIARDSIIHIGIIQETTGE